MSYLNPSSENNIKLGFCWFCKQLWLLALQFFPLICHYLCSYASIWVIHKYVWLKWLSLLFASSFFVLIGTGHETNFAAWLYCLARLQIVKEEYYQALVSRVFVKYLELMRKLQLTYSVEPAGSHGEWELDDYHFLPFIFGSSRLIDYKYM